MAALLVLAGCAGGPGSTTTQTTTQQTTTTQTAERTGTVNFYVSDRPGAIEDFASLNVTVTQIGLHRANVSESGTSDGETNESAAVVVQQANNTTTTTTSNQTTTTSENETTTTTTTAGDGDEKAGDGYKGKSWILKDINDTTVDLTELQGENATLLGDLQVPADDYDKVFVYVKNAEGTLKSGEHVDVKVPSQKLQVHSEFTVAPNETVTFVYDMMVHQAGDKYIVRPVISQTGAGKDVKAVEKKDAKQKGEAAFDVSHTNLTVGENATFTVTKNGSAVANATVKVNGETVGVTNASGQVVAHIPDETVEVVVVKGEYETEVVFEAEKQAKDGDKKGGRTTTTTTTTTTTSG